MPPPKQKPIAASRSGRNRGVQLAHAGLHVRDEPLNRDLRQCGGDLGFAWERGGAALARKQVDRERRVPGGGEAARDRADVVVEPAVLVYHEQPAARGHRRGPRAHQRHAVRPVPRDRHGGDGRPVGRRRARGGGRGAASTGRPRGGRAEHHTGRRAGDAEQPEPPHCLPPRDDAVRMILCHLFGQVALELRHRRLPEVRSACTRVLSDRTQRRSRGFD